jgi:hypothetical protein
MRRTLLALVAASAAAGSASAQQAAGSNNAPIIRTPPSSNGASYGTSGNVGTPTPMYPGRLRDYNNPAASYGRVYVPNTNQPNRR